jgi:hypothetical protein
MDSDELEAVMARFIAGKTTCSFARRFIESWPRYPKRQYDHHRSRAIVRSGRSLSIARTRRPREHKAYAYLLLPREMMTIGAARKRINAIKQYSSLGAGFASPCAIWRFGAQAAFWARLKAATSWRSVSTCIASCSSKQLLSAKVRKSSFG